MGNSYEGTRPRSFISYPSNVLSHDVYRQIGNVYDPRPRASGKLKAIYAFGATGKRTVVLADTTVYVQFDVCEPIMLSPFIFGSGNGKQGFYGIQTMNFQMNMASTANRAWRCALVPDGNTGSSKEVAVESFEDSLLYF